jgi:hypothetical protein
MTDNETKTKATKYDVLVSETGRDGKTYWHRVGVAFPNTRSLGMTFRFFGKPTSYVIMESQRPAANAAQDGASEEPAF